MTNHSKNKTDMCAVKKPEIKLYTLGGAFGMRSVSPFCLKLEMLLAHLGVDYSLVIEPDPRTAPKGKMPWAKIDGEVISDSEIIIETINRLTEGQVYDGLTPREQAYGLGMVRLAEEHLYWLLASARWLDDDWWPNVKRDFMKIIPAVVRTPVSSLIRRRMRQTVLLQGLGAHTLEEQFGFARRNLGALQDAVGESAYLFGEKVSVFDIGIAAIMVGIYDNQPATRLTNIANEFTGLKAHTERVQDCVGVYGRK